MLTREELAQARAEEMALAQRHALEAEKASKPCNQTKNGELYAKIKKGRKFKIDPIKRQCPQGVDPVEFTIPDTSLLTYVQVQYFKNNKSGQAKHVLKVEWSCNPDPKKASDPYYQTTTFFNLYEKYQIKYKAKMYMNDVMGASIANQAKEVNKNLDVDSTHLLQEVTFGFCTVQVTGGGTQLFGDHYAFMIPLTKDEKNIAVVHFQVGDTELSVLLADVTARSDDRKKNSALMVGYKPQITEEEELKIIERTIKRLKK